MLDFLGWKAEAKAVKAAVREALKQNFVTPDLGGTKRTVEVGDWLAATATKLLNSN
jgi:isocitrate/isopropylmalate dehydrogenase